MSISRYKLHLMIWIAAALLQFAAPTVAEAQNRNRETIDSLRWGYEYNSAEAYRRANQAQHLDSTYYVGYLIEGYHFSERAEELSGLAKAVPPLRKAIDLFEKDFGRLLKRRIDGEAIFGGAWRDLLKQLDYYDLSNRLINTYITLEQPDSAYAASRRLLSKNLVFDFQSLHWISWLYFRSRIYTSEKYGFLRDSIEENMQEAVAYSDTMEMRYKKNVGFIRREIMGVFVPNTPFYNAFSSSFIEGPMSTLANTRGILYGYNLNPELAASYFKKMPGDDNLAKNVNLGYTYLSAVDLREAEKYFSDVPDMGSRSRGGHWQGFSIVQVSKDTPFAGAAHLQADRDSHGYTIGYGWDNLCLARMYLYAGQLDECASALAKAENFKEVHYNTSFREDQYRFMLKTLQLMLTNARLKATKFENKNNWIAFDWWKRFPGLTLEKYTMLYRLANEMADNPEREMVFYRPFHSESIISFDELWFIIQNYSTNYFKKVFSEDAQTDPRENVDRYYRYFSGMLQREDGESEKAYDTLTETLSDSKLDNQYERLLIARIHQNAGEIAAEEGWQPQRIFHTNMLYQNYPELVPFSGLQMAFRLNVNESLANETRWQNIEDDLQDFNINWDAPENENWPEVQIAQNGDSQLQYQVIVNREVFTQGIVEISQPGAAKRLVYALFRINRK
ncbi:MAG: hypothetical protein KDH95_04580 [Calditrichaeota bacterium]|nr:hypothetical protein [Calditrichota bacterium]